MWHHVKYAPNKLEKIVDIIISYLRLDTSTLTFSGFKCLLLYHMLDLLLLG